MRVHDSCSWEAGVDLGAWGVGVSGCFQQPTPLAQPKILQHTISKSLSVELGHSPSLPPKPTFKMYLPEAVKSYMWSHTCTHTRQNAQMKWYTVYFAYNKVRYNTSQFWHHSFYVIHFTYNKLQTWQQFKLCPLPIYPKFTVLSLHTQHSKITQDLEKAHSIINIYSIYMCNILHLNTLGVVAVLVVMIPDGIIVYKTTTNSQIPLYVHGGGLMQYSRTSLDISVRGSVRTPFIINSAHLPIVWAASSKD